MPRVSNHSHLSLFYADEIHWPSADRQTVLDLTSADEASQRDLRFLAQGVFWASSIEQGWASCEPSGFSSKYHRQTSVDSSIPRLQKHLTPESYELAQFLKSSESCDTGTWCVRASSESILDASHSSDSILGRTSSESNPGCITLVGFDFRTNYM